MQNSKAAAVILTFNEEHNIANAVTNASQYFKDVFVLDSLSTDNTVAKAKEAGTKVFENKFEDYASQRNCALEKLKADYDWVFFLDADEELNEELGKNVQYITSKQPNNQIAYEMKRINHFLGQPLNYTVGPDYQTRLLGKFDELEYFSKVHERLNLEKEQIKQVSGHIIHKDVSCMQYLFNKTNNQSDLEVEQRKLYSLPHSVFRLLNVPIRTFLSHYVMKRGFLDGYRGFLYSYHKGVYRAVIISKQIEKLLQK
jgi:glycosyltransferase involved in cell wall biosynthesis